jgi:hypothetical protein
MPSTRAWVIAPAIATSSRPPRQRRTSKRIAEAAAFAATPAATAAVFAARPASSTPVPRPVQSAAVPP